MIVGANPAESHPVLSTRLRRAKKKFGQKLIVADLRKNEMANRADLFLHPKPGTDFVWLAAVTKYILRSGKAAKDFLEARVNGLDKYVQSLEMYTLEYAEEVTGIPRDVLADVANRIADAKSVCICWAMGITQHVCGSETSTAICNLLLVTGNVGRPGTGAYPLRGHNNVQGRAISVAPGLLPRLRAGGQRPRSPKYEKRVGRLAATTNGLDNHQMVDAIHDGKLRSDVSGRRGHGRVDSNANLCRAAFEKLDFFVVQDMFFSKTAPVRGRDPSASPSLEKEGTFTNTERRMQRLYQALAAAGRVEARLANHSESCRQPPRCQLEIFLATRRSLRRRAASRT